MDLIIIGRGGGSLEDLWPFNEEAVARAVFDCSIPVVSAVGHEVDFSISDFVADVRAATPTQAAVISTPDINELRFQIEDDVKTIEQLIGQKIEYYREYIHRLTHSHALLVVRDKLSLQENRVENLIQKMESRIDHLLLEKESAAQRLSSGIREYNPLALIERRTDQVKAFRDQIASHYFKVLSEKRARYNLIHSELREMNPKAPLEKGFTRIIQNGSWIRSSTRFDPNIETKIEWKDGSKKLSGSG